MKTLISRLRDSAAIVEIEGYLNSARYMENAAEELEILYEFYETVVNLTKNHSILVDSLDNDHAVVYPSYLGEALSKVDPLWWKDEEI